MKAIWENEILAESEETVVIEGNHYFPMDSIKPAYFVKSETQTHCPWKGEASYYSLQVNGIENRDAAWYYQNPKPAAMEIKNCIAFWKGVQIVDS